MCGATNSLAVLFSKPSLLQLKAVSHCPSLLLSHTRLNHRCPYLVKPFWVLAKWRGSGTRQWMMSLMVLRSRCLSPGCTAYRKRQHGSQRQFVHDSSPLPPVGGNREPWSFDRKGVGATLTLVKLRSIYTGTSGRRWGALTASSSCCARGSPVDFNDGAGITEHAPRDRCRRCGACSVLARDALPLNCFRQLAGWDLACELFTRLPTCFCNNDACQSVARTSGFALNRNRVAAPEIEHMRTAIRLCSARPTRCTASGTTPNPAGRTASAHTHQTSKKTCARLRLAVSLGYEINARTIVFVDYVEQEMQVAAVGSAFRRLGSIGSPHLAQVP
jgi:hypothetical protein